MYHFEKKFKIFTPEGPREDVSLGLAVSLDGPALHDRSLAYNT